MKKHFLLKEIDIPIYRGKLVIILTNSKKKLIKEIPKFGGPRIYGHAINKSYKGKDGYFIVLNTELATTAITPGVIAHESFHTAAFILGNRDVHFDIDNDEPYAYLLDWVVDQVYLFLKETGRLDKIKGVM